MKPIEIFEFFRTQRHRLCYGVDMPECDISYSATPYEGCWHLKFDHPVEIDGEKVRTVNIGSSACRADMRFRWKDTEKDRPAIPDEKTGMVLRWYGKIYYRRIDEKGDRVCSAGTGGVWKNGENGIFRREELRTDN